MNKILTSILLIGLLSCSNHNSKTELEKLQFEKDSLLEIVESIKTKYVFDSISIRQIPHYSNTDKLNSIHREEFVFVGYNEKTKVVIGDSIYFENGIKVNNGDTLTSKKGGFNHHIKLIKERNSYSGVLKTESNFGKSYETYFKSTIQTNN